LGRVSPPVYCDLMTYASSFHRLVLLGEIYNDIWNTSLSIVPSALGEIGMPEVSVETLEAVAEDVRLWFTAAAIDGGLRPLAPVRLTGIKLNRIDINGHYEDPETREFTYPTAAVGVGNTYPPPQLSLAATLRTRLPRGRGSRGRMYLPPVAAFGSPGTDGRLTAAQATDVASSVASLVERLNATYTLVGRVGVASNAGAGVHEHVTEIGVGRTIDTIRSRRSSLIEDYQIVPIE
jgi:hypothetical protein